MENLARFNLSSLVKREELERLIDNRDDVKYITYGTAGFRGKVEEIEHLFRRVGFITGMKCRTQRTNVGVMITASHNPIEDNGVKIIDSMGEMIDPEWEKVVEEFCNLRASSVEDLLELLLSSLYTIDPKTVAHLDDPPLTSKIYIGCDTRPSSKKLVDLVIQGLNGVILGDHGYEFVGELTTPALHHIVAEATLRPTECITCTDYYNKLLNGFVASFDESAEVRQYYDSKELVIDCANGVGSKTMQYFNQANDGIFRKYLRFELINVGLNSDDILNFECGADFVKTKHLPPRGATELNKRYASLDGDADRVVYFYLNQDPTIGLKLMLLDGDKILALYAKYMTDILRKYQLSIELAAIQTAYANGASTDYLKYELALNNVECVDTGVKHLHKKATCFDIGIYFEANGHGTIWLSTKACAIIEQKKITELQKLKGILNNYTGDAISDILITEMILKHYDWDIRQWDKLYQDRANSLIKVDVADRNLIVTTDAGRTCLKPVGLQKEVDKLVSQFGSGSRSFVRASGTENVVRVYAESSDQERADQLAQLVGEKVKEFCDT